MAQPRAEILDTRERADRALRGGPRARGARSLLAAPRQREGPAGALRELAGRGGGARTWRSTGRARRGTASWGCGATRRRSGIFLQPSGRSNGRSAPRSWDTTARRRGSCRRAAAPCWRPSSSRRRAPARRRGSSGSGSCATRASSATPTRPRSGTSTWPRRSGASAIDRGRRAPSPRRSACWRPPPTPSRRAGSRSGPSTATACCSGSASRPARSRTSPRAT